MAKEVDWTSLELAKETTLILGFRPRPGSKKLASGRVEIKKQLAETLAAAGERWLLNLQARARTPYESDLHLEPEEYLGTTISELASHAVALEDGEPEEDQGSELHTIISNAFSSDEWFTADELKRNFLFYAIVVRLKSGGSVGFVKQASPQRVAKTGGWLTMYDDTLSEIDAPVFVLEPDIDIVVHGEDIAVLRPLAFERLFADLELSKELIPVHTKTITSSLACAETLGGKLEQEADKKARARRLLRDLSSFSEAQWAARTTEKIREVLDKRKLEHGRFFNSHGDLEVADDHVVTLLEVLASRYYTSDFDHEEMRADKVRRRM